MIQITYQPAYDPFHTIYRVFRLASQLKQVEIDKARILDFYLLYPFLMADIRFKRDDQHCRKTARKYEDRKGYAIQPSPRRLFDSMRPVYEAATQTMAAEGYLDLEALRAGTLMATSKPPPAQVAESASADNAAEHDLVECLSTLLRYDLLGSDGLKARTGLMEHRNDAA